MEKYNVIVIGQGYAGLMASKLANERGLRVLNLEGNCMGGLILSINELDPVPEGAEHVGAELASSIAMSNMDNGVDTLPGLVSSIERGGNGEWVVRTEEESYGAPHVVVASGARLRKLGVPGEEEFFGQGVSECADCDGPMFQDTETLVVGSGDSAFQEALSLTQFSSKVTIAMRSSQPKARAEFLERAAANEKIEQLHGVTVAAIEGAAGRGVESVTLNTPEGEKKLPVSGVFIFIGLVPNTSFLSTEIRRDEAGALVTSGTCALDAPGLWAVGAVRSGYKGTLSDAAVDAETAIAGIAKAIQSAAIQR